MAQTCAGPCNNAYRKAEEAHTTLGTEHAITPNWGQPTQCWDCVDRTRQHLTELPALLAAVRDEALEGTPTRPVGTIGRAGLHHSWPGQASRLLVDRIVGEMAELQADILTRRGIWAPDRQPGPGTTANEDRRIARVASVLAAHWDWAMQHHPAADESYGRGSANPGSQATGWHRAAVHFTKQDEQRDVRRLAPCPRCHGPYLVESRDLRLVDGHPYVECRDPDCRRVMTQAEYDAYVKAMSTSIRAAA